MEVNLLRSQEKRQQCHLRVHRKHSMPTPYSPSHVWWVQGTCHSTELWTKQQFSLTLKKQLPWRFAKPEAWVSAEQGAGTGTTVSRHGASSISPLRMTLGSNCIISCPRTKVPFGSSIKLILWANAPSILQGAYRSCQSLNSSTLLPQKKHMAKVFWITVVANI